MIRAALRYRHSVAPANPHDQCEVKKRDAKNKDRTGHRQQIGARVARIHRQRCEHESDKEATCIAEIDFRRVKVIPQETKNPPTEHDAQERYRLASGGVVRYSN